MAFKKLGYNRKLVEELSHHVSPKFKLFYRTRKKKGFNLINAMLLKPHVFVIYEWPHTELVRTCFDIDRQASINSIF